MPGVFPPALRIVLQQDRGIVADALSNDVDRVEQEERMRWWNLKSTKPSASARLREFADRIYARDAGISKPQCVTGNASPPPNFEGSS
jgi:hypothetical protein